MDALRKEVTAALEAAAASPATADDGSQHELKQATLRVLAALPPGVAPEFVGLAQRRFLTGQWFEAQLWTVLAGTPDEYLPVLLGEIEHAVHAAAARDALAFIAAASRADETHDQHADAMNERCARFRRAARAMAKFQLSQRGPITRLAAAAARLIAEDPPLLRAAQETVNRRPAEHPPIEVLRAYLWAALAQDAAPASLASLERALTDTQSPWRELLDRIVGLYAATPGIADLMARWSIAARADLPTPVPPLPGRHPDLAYRIDEGQSAQHDGWARGRPPGLTPEQWPRGDKSAVPLAHVFTLRLPEAYRTRGPEYVALSLFAQASELPDTSAETSTDTLAPLKRDTTPHPTASRDDWWSESAWLWLTEAEYAGAPCPPPTLTGPVAPAWALALRAFEASDLPPEWLALVPYADPNVGLLPTDAESEEEAAYTPWSSARGEALMLMETITTRASGNHLGGTYLGVQPADGLSATFFELEDEFAGLNLGGDEGLFDLAKNTWTWGR